MAIIPLKQKVLIERSIEEDEWGEKLTQTFELKCRVDEGAKVVKNRQGVEVVSSAQILLNKMADVTYDDYVVFTDELGRTMREKPLAISPIRMINGKATLTEVAL